MSGERVVLEKFELFMDGVEVAPVKGIAVDLACERLSDLPGFRSPDEADLVSWDTINARVTAVDTLGIRDIALEVGMLDRRTAYTVFSSLGARAMRTESGTALQEALRSIRQLDGGNKHILLPTYLPHAI